MPAAPDKHCAYTHARRGYKAHLPSKMHRGRGVIPLRYCAPAFARQSALHQFVRSARGKTPVAAEAGHEKAGAGARQRRLQIIAVFGGGVENNRVLWSSADKCWHRIGGQFVALIAKITFHFKFNIITILKTIAVQSRGRIFCPTRFRQIGNVAHHAAIFRPRLGSVWWRA